MLSTSGRSRSSADSTSGTSVQAATIVPDDKKGNLNASGGVRSSWRLLDTDPKTKDSA